MEENTNLLESLLERASDYGKTSLELVRLKTLEKSTDVVSSLVPHTIAVVLISSVILFLNLGLALWLGDILGRIFYGFFAVGLFYILAVMVIHFFMHKWIKKVVADYLVKHVLK